ncbi:MAG TPA: hypothetical protein VH518_08985 [Tepidisphaeraceae bacterium]|jgi:hypothetical protein
MPARGRREAAPPSPWLSNPAWANGTVLDESRRWGAAAWGVAIFFVLMSVPIVGVSISELIHPRSRSASDIMTTAFVMLIFGGISAGLLGLAIYFTLLRRKYGAVRLELSTFPGAIGGSLAGTIVTGRPLQLMNNLHLTLSCWEHAVGAARGTSNTLLWQGEQALSPRLPGDPSGARIPVFFTIPSHCSPSGHERNRIRWRLTANSPMPGVDFHASFIVPVFKVAEQQPIEDMAQPYRVTHEPPAVVQGRGVAMSVDESGDMEARFAAARHPLVAAQYTAFAAAFAATPWLLAWYGAGRWLIIGFGIFLGLIALIVGIEAWGLWFCHSRVSARNSSLDLRCGQFFFSRTLHFDAADITRVKTEKTKDSGPSPWYSLELRTRLPRHPLVVVTDGLSRHDANLIASRLRTAIKAHPDRKS